MSEKEGVHEILSKALDADESNDIADAVNYYMRAVERILQIKDAHVRDQLNKYAVQALDRAEELRGISSPKHKAVASAAQDPEAHESQRNHGKCTTFPSLSAALFPF